MAKTVKVTKKRGPYNKKKKKFSRHSYTNVQLGILNEYVRNNEPSLYGARKLLKLPAFKEGPKRSAGSVANKMRKLLSEMAAKMKKIEEIPVPNKPEAPKVKLQFDGEIIGDQLTVRFTTNLAHLREVL